MMKRAPIPLLLTLGACLCLPGCRNREVGRREYQIGERVSAGPLTYNVIEKVWRSQLGEGFQIRVPQNRFLLITVSATNSGGGEVSVPILQLEDPEGKLYSEVESGEGVDNWIGLVRTIEPAQTLQGRLVFDVPLSTYRLRLSDGDPASGHFVYVQIPLQIDADPPVEPPSVGRQ